LLKNIFRFISTYWGDFAFFSILPFFLVFYSQASKDMPVVDGYFVPVVDRQHALLLFFLYLTYVVMSLVRILFFKKRLLRDWSYLVVGSVATLCFVAYLPSSSFDRTLFSSQISFLNYASLLQNTSVVFLDARIAIGLYKFFKEGKPVIIADCQQENPFGYDNSFLE